MKNITDFKAFESEETLDLPPGWEGSDRDMIIFFIAIDMKKLCQTSASFGRYR